MKKIVSSWDKDRLSKAIELFISKDGKYFSLLEKIYKDDGNYSNNSISKTEINYSIPKTKFHNFTENFLDGFESEEAFDRHIEDKLRQIVWENIMIHKTLEEHLAEQRELYKQYTDPADRQLIEICANKIKELIKGDVNNENR